MKKLLSLLFTATLAIGATITNADAKLTAEVRDFKSESLLTFLGKRLTYPEKARLKNLQGPSIVLFTVTKGKLSDVNIHQELGEGADVSIVNAILAYPDFKQEKDGKYALKVDFLLGDAQPNANKPSIPAGYQLLELVVKAMPATEIVNWSYTPTETNARAEGGLIIRGTGAEFNKPKLIVDGNALEYGSLNDIDPNTIASFSILKGASAIAAYGDDAQFGAIVVTTKAKKETKKEEPVKSNKN